MDTRPIGVFDSGLGGLTAVRQLRRVLPGEDIVYFGDTGRVPYGSRGRDVIVQYARQDIRFLLSRDVKFVLAACGTVSSTYPPEEAARERSMQQTLLAIREKYGKDAVLKAMSLQDGATARTRFHQIGGHRA